MVTARNSTSSAFEWRAHVRPSVFSAVQAKCQEGMGTMGYKKLADKSLRDLAVPSMDFEWE